MDKNAIKKYAVWARRELISRVSQRALLYGISEKGCGDSSADTVNGHLLTASEKRQRQSLIAKIKKDGYQQAMEAAAYTWFNRFSALRFMEVNGYLPSHVRVFTDEDNNFKPQILAEAIHLDIDGLDMDKVYAMKDANKTDELYKYLLITQCNALGAVLPGMFTRIEDYTELLFPDNLLREGSVIEQMIALIPQEDWTDQVQIIGWLYESYNIERNELVYNGNLSKARIPKELLSAATTIFTPDWPIRYMVENSLGRLWVEGHPNDELKANWKYYLEEAEQEPEVQKQLTEIRKEYAALKPEDIRCIDPCMGSGHILVYMFDVLMQIYEAYGYNTREAAGLILQNNLYGLDIDDRASQLAYFAVMMKARQYDRRIFSRGIQPHVYAIVESNGITHDVIEYFENGSADLKKALGSILTELYDAKEYGSILNLTPVDFAALYARFDEISEDISIFQNAAINELKPLVQVAEAMAQKYHVVVTNPPYLGSSRFSPKLDSYVKDNYQDEKADLSMVVFKHAIKDMVLKNCFVSFITTSSWLFLSSFEKLRAFLQNGYSFCNLVDFGTELFEGKVGHNPITAWVTRRSNIKYTLSAVRLVDYCYSRRDEKESEFYNKENYYFVNKESFSKLPTEPIAYWASNSIIKAFDNPTIGNIAKPRQGLATGENDRFTRLWFEVPFSHICFDATSREEAEKSQKRWFPYNKGGEFRKWYGNNDYIVNWENDGLEIRNFKDEKGKLRSRPQNMDCYFRPSITWSKISSGSIAFRYKPAGHIFDVAGTSIFTEDNVRQYIHGFCNSAVALRIAQILSPTLNYEVGHIASFPVIFDNEKADEITRLVEENIALSKIDWDSDETSWDFLKHPFIGNFKSIKEAYEKWRTDCNLRYKRLKENEEQLNKLFISIYQLDRELDFRVDDKAVTVKGDNLKRDIKSFISYAVGCMFGRYSLDCDGVISNGNENKQELFITYLPDKDGIIPICDEEYFNDDIVELFVDFVRKAYGELSLEENLSFVAKALDANTNNARDTLRTYFLNDFYSDHCATYSGNVGRRPIYWLFDSGKKGGFKALIYMHRYQPVTIARIRTDYVHEQQARYRTAIADLENRIAGASTSERVKLNKQLQKLQAQADEIRAYEEKIHHLADMMIPIDLDDGVKVNYAKFEDVLAKIK